MSDIRAAAMDIIRTSWRMSDPIRLLTVTAINLVDETEDEQLSLFDALAGFSASQTPAGAPQGSPTAGATQLSGSTPSDIATATASGLARREAAESMERAMDEIRRKYGSDSIGYGAALGNDIGIDL